MATVNQLRTDPGIKIGNQIHNQASMEICPPFKGDLEYICNPYVQYTKVDGDTPSRLERVGCTGA